MNMSLLALEVCDLFFAYQEKIIFENLALKLHPGERVALIGPSGHGKSTLLKILTGLLRPQKGQVYHFGETIDFFSRSEKEQFRVQKRMGLLFQKNALFDSMTALENIVFSLEESGQVSDPQESLRIARHFLKATQLEGAESLYPSQMSGGMQKRLAIARLLALGPELCFFDEPTAGLDPVTSRHIVNLIMELSHGTQQTQIMVTSEIARAFQFAERILFCYQRQLLDLGSPLQARHNTRPEVRQFLEAKAEGPIQF
jgi:phospholipid/cholesterol/gamma-HCH transport system ATP-binding protein